MSLLLFSGPIVLATCFRLTQQSKKGGQILVGAWLATMLLSAVLGFLLWTPSDESTRLASAMLLTSPVILFGPVLLAFRAKSVSNLVLGILTLIVPSVSAVGAFFLLAASKQIWGM